MGVLSGNPKDEPMHYGEIFDAWAFSAKAKGTLSFYQALLYHTGDRDLQKLIEDLIDQAKLEIKELDALLTSNGIAPAPDLPERPHARLEDIPAGARFSDPEIAMMISSDLAAGMVLCSQVIGKSIREDIGILFGKYHATRAAQASRALRMNKEKGWLVPPPLQIKRPEPAGV